jgi:hypothetical protein
MSRFVPASWSTVYVGRGSRVRVDPVAGVEELTGFQDHFDDVFITVIFGTFAGVPVEEEDVHLEG